MLLTQLSSLMAAQNMGEWHPSDMGEALLATWVFGFSGILLAILGFKAFDRVIRFDLEKEICEKQNTAVAILCGSIIVGVSVIIACAVV